MKLLLVYHYRLGDILRILPIARHFAAQGCEVAVECYEQYHGIFSAVSYARPVAPNHTEHFNRIERLQLWPDHAEAFHASGKTWLDFVYGLAPDFAGIDRNIVFDRIDEQPAPAAYGLPARYSLLCPFGYSQSTPRPFAELYTIACRENADPRPFVVADSQQSIELAKHFPLSRIVTCYSPAHLVRLIRDASAVTAINSAPCVIAGASRASYTHVSDFDARNAAITPASRVVES